MRRHVFQRDVALTLTRPAGRKRGAALRRVVVNEWMSLDGVVQSAGADDDTTEGFTHAGWHLPYFDEVSQRWVVDGYARAGGFLFGRRTYDLLVGC